MTVLESIQKSIEYRKGNILKSFGIEDNYFEKAHSHKYIRKEPDGKGGFNYIYEEHKEGDYNKIKESIAVLFDKKLNIERQITNLNRRKEEFLDINNFIKENKNQYGDFTFNKNESDIVNKEISVKKRDYNGGWNENIDVVVELKKKSQSNKYKYYEIAKVIDDNGLNKHLKSQIPLIDKEINQYNLKLKETDNELLNYKNELKNTENPNIKIYKKELQFLNESKQSAISDQHKKEIDQVIYNIEENKFNRNEFNKVWYTGAKQYVSNIIRQLGGKKYHKSSKDVSGSVYYELNNGDKIRISDHELPDTESRREKREMGIGGDWIEFVLDEPKSFLELKENIFKDIQSSIDFKDNKNDKDKELINKIKSFKK